MATGFWIDHNSQRYTGEGPNECPLCHFKITTDSPLAQAVGQKFAQFVFRCPNCRDLFIAYYELIPNAHQTKLSNLGGLELRELKPSVPTLEAISETIQKISPMFATIFNEAKLAKELGLMQICGPGYRKAFEFLIKDYAKIKVATDEEREAVEKAFAGVIVNDYIDDKRIQAVAKRALWLGNDETHYLRKWEKHDVEDLITLIRLTIHWIEIEQLSNQYVTGMPE